MNGRTTASSLFASRAPGDSPADGSSLRLLVIAATAVIVLLVVGLMVEKSQRVLAGVERQKVDLTGHQISTQLNLAAAEALTQRDANALARLGWVNPLSLGGGASAPDKVAVPVTSDSGLPPGQWVFDRSRSTLLYRYSHHHEAYGNEAVIGLRVRLHYEDKDANGRFEFPGDLFLGVKVERLVLAYL